MDTITITPFKEGMDMEKTKRELDIHANGYHQGYKAAINKACEWIYEHFLDYCSDPIGCRFDDCAEDFRKAMEE